MNKFLPKSLKNPQGFTLIELMIVVSIIAILSVIGVTVFGNIQVRGRDSRRISDIEAISKAMEVHKLNNGNYIALASTQFSANRIPTDPGNNVYCANATANAVPGTFISACPGGWTVVGAGSPAAGLAWTVCAATESPVGIQCRSNQQ